MCGINGFNFEDEKLAREMVRLTAHRGPDDSGFYIGNGYSLGHSRLSIIDLSEKGHQPMWSRDGRYAIVFNGEIYNFEKLRAELKDKGYVFNSETDTEVILSGYEEWGKGIANKLYGIFAFAILDVRERELFLARDHIGVKPLYYYYDGVQFAFSSEIKSILAHPIPRKLNKDALNLYLAASYVPGPHTLYKDIYKLLPAHYMTVKGGKISITEYWKAGGEPKLDGSMSDIAPVRRKKVISAVVSQLVSDRPLGVYLSGGIDSSVVLASMKQARADIDTFSIGFDLTEEEETEKFNADFMLARRTAAHFGTNHHEVLVSSQDMVESMENIIWHMDEPISNPTAVAMYKLAQFTKDKADVVLGGEGGDELLGGYSYYSLNKAADWFRMLPAWLRFSLEQTSSTFAKLNTPPGLERYALFMLRNKNEVEEYANKSHFDYESALAFFGERFFVNDEPGISSADALMRAHRESWLVDHALMLTDKMSMASAVEVRVPLLDRGVVEYAVKIPAQYKASLRDTKIIMKEAFKKDLPLHLFGQPKRGWFSPGAKWLRHKNVLAIVREVLAADYYPETAHLFDWDVLQHMIDSHSKRESYYRIPLWAIFIFQLWAKRYRVTV